MCAGKQPLLSLYTVIMKTNFTYKQVDNRKRCRPPYNWLLISKTEYLIEMLIEIAKSEANIFTNALCRHRKGF